MRFARSIFHFIPILFVATAVGQSDPDAAQGQELRLSRAQEISRFHANPVKGSDASVRQAAWEQRRKLMDDSVFGNVLWRNIGPYRQGGRVVDIEAAKNDPDQVFVAFATGGLWKTDDDGITWKLLFSQEAAYAIGDFTVSADGKTIYVGTGEANSQRTGYSGDGIYKSVDGGKTWTNVGLRESHHVGRVVIDPKNPNIVWVAALGSLYSPNDNRGVYKSTDGGKSWIHVLKGDETTGAIDLVVDPRGNGVAFAAMYDRQRRAWNLREGGKGAGVFRTADAGRTWRRVEGLPSGEEAGRYGLAISQSRPDVLIATIDNKGEDSDWEALDEFTPSGTLTPRRFLRFEAKTFLEFNDPALEAFWTSYAPSTYTLEQARADVKGGKSMADVVARLKERSAAAFSRPTADNEMYRTKDGGKNWDKVKLGDLGTGNTYYFGECWINPSDPNDMVAAGMNIIRSRDGGNTWDFTADNGVHVDHHAYHWDSRNPRKIWSGNDGGVYLSGDSGETWRHLNNLSVGQTTTLAVDMKSPYNVYVGLQDNGTMKGPSTFRAGFGSTDPWTTIGGGDGSAIAVDPRDDGDVVFIASQFGAHSARNQKTNTSWNARPSGRGLRFNWISPVLISPHHPDVVYIGSQQLHRSLNGGRKFDPISPDLTKNLPNGNVPYSTLKDISESPLRFGLIYTGADDGSVKMTPDGGYQWIDIPTPAPDKWVSRVVASKFDVGTVYVAQNGYRDDDWTAYLWKSTDFGKTWSSIVGNLPAESINVIREDPEQSKTLYVGTDMGVYVTFDGGTTWETLHGGMPTVAVHDLVIHPREKDLVIATHGRGVFILPLKQVYDVTPELRAAALTLFDLAPMRRSPTWGFERRELWQQASPAPEPKLRGSFFAKAKGKATIALKDKDGKVVRETSVDALKGYNNFEVSLMLTPSKITSAIVPPSKDQKDILKDSREGLRATYLGVGDYTVEVKLGDATASKIWKLN